MISNLQNVQSAYGTGLNTQTDMMNAHAKNTSVNIDDVGAVFEKQEEVATLETYQVPKKLTAEQIDALKNATTDNTIKLITQVVGQNVTNQAAQTTISYNGLELSSQSVGVMTDIFGSLENALPPLATTPEQAQTDIAPGGVYSIEKVSERIMLMATTFAGEDMDVLAEMQAAVVKGFEQAGLNTQTGEGMPEITMDTFEYVMGQFDSLLNPQQEVATEQ